MLNWDDYRIFLDVARSGSLSAASATLKIDPATVGRRITRLEKSLGSKLFNKLPRGYQLTQAGSDLQEHIEHIERTEKKHVEHFKKLLQQFLVAFALVHQMAYLITCYPL